MASCSFFSLRLDVKRFSVGDQGRDALWEWLDTLLAANENKRMTLFFDESQHLIVNNDGWHFRAIRWWLRRFRETNVVSVFAGTNTSLANYFVESEAAYSSRDVNIECNKGSKLYPPFYEITTTGLVSCTDGSKFECTRRTSDGSTDDTVDECSEFDVAVQYGRPLFARMQLKGELKNKLESILLRMRGGVQHTSEGILSFHRDFPILATRLQMGQVPFDFASRQVAGGYAYLTHFVPHNNAAAEIAYLPDPVCAWLAMTQMIKNCQAVSNANASLMGKHPSVWSEKAIQMYSSALCRPEKGDVGEVAAAFYMLACGDELRFESAKNLSQLSVPLEMWIERLHGNQSGSLANDDAQTEGPTVNFIQFCRNYLRHSVKEIQDSGLLRHWYRGARALYAYACCPAYDLLIPVKYKHGNGYEYCPMLVSVKNRLSYSEKQRTAAVDAMKSALEDASDATGVCMLLLIGLERQSLASRHATKFKFSHGSITTVVVEVPQNDEFGATNLAMCPTCGGGEKSEVMVSHSELALGAKATFTRLLRSKTTKDDASKIFLDDIKNHYLQVLNKYQVDGDDV